MALTPSPELSGHRNYFLVLVFKASKKVLFLSDPAFTNPGSSFSGGTLRLLLGKPQKIVFFLVAWPLRGGGVVRTWLLRKNTVF